MLADRLLFEKKHADFLIEFAHLLDQILVRLFGNSFVLRRDIHDLVGRSDMIAVGVNDRFLIQDVDLSLEIIFFAQRK